MTRFARDPLYRRHRFPAEVIAHAVWLYFRFPLSLRIVEDILAARGIIVSHQTVRLWAEKFGRRFANDICKRSAGRLGDKWYLDEVVITIRGKKHWLWRAVDRHGKTAVVKAAKRLTCKLLKGQSRSPRVIITDKLRSYSAAKRDIMPGVEQSPTSSKFLATRPISPLARAASSSHEKRGAKLHAFAPPEPKRHSHILFQSVKFTVPYDGFVQPPYVLYLRS